MMGLLLDKITSVSLTGPEDGLLTMLVRLPEGESVDSLFSVSNKQEVDGFFSQLEASLEK